MSFLSPTPSVPKPTPLPSVPQQASFISRGGDSSSQRAAPLRPLTPVIGASRSRTGAPSLLGG